MIIFENEVLASPEQMYFVLRGMRNPMNSWDKMDSSLDSLIEDDSLLYDDQYIFHFGENDYQLALKLSKAGTDHRKFMRMIPLYIEITAPLYWWKEFDTYKVGTVANSCSTMHKLTSKDLTFDDFSFEDFEINGSGLNYKSNLASIIQDCNEFIRLYKETGDAKYWKGLICELPESYMQKRSVMLNYEVLRNIYHSRKNHKLDEWHKFCEYIECLPYSKLIIED